MIDEEVRKLIDEAYERTKKLLTEKKEQVLKLQKHYWKKKYCFRVMWKI